MKDSSAKILAFAILGVCVIITIWLLIVAGDDGYRPWEHYLDFAATGQFGDFIGGVIGTLINGAAFYFLYLTLQEQKAATLEQKTATNEQKYATIEQAKAFQTERLESKFFDLVKMHRENVSELKMRSTKITETFENSKFQIVEEESKAVIKDIFYQFVDCRNELLLFFRELKRVYEKEHRKELENNPLIGPDTQKLLLFAKIDICYSIVYYGVSGDGVLILQKIFEGRYKQKFINDIINYIRLKPATGDDILKKWIKIQKRGSRLGKIEIANKIINWRNKRTPLSITGIDEDDTIESLVNGYHGKFIKYYGGHQFRLGHYFRHLYQSVKFINNQLNLSYEEKYEYIKTLRAQLSNYEQALLFLNSLSYMGRSWEIIPEVKTSMINQGEVNFQLITKYNLVKNMPGETLYGIPFKLFYPNVQYEGKGISRDNSLYK